MNQNSYVVTINNERIVATGTYARAALNKVKRPVQGFVWEQCDNQDYEAKVYDGLKYLYFKLGVK